MVVKGSHLALQATLPISALAAGWHNHGNLDRHDWITD
jgi:hypothetical protein